MPYPRGDYATHGPLGTDTARQRPGINIFNAYLAIVFKEFLQCFFATPIAWIVLIFPYNEPFHVDT